MNAYYNEIDGYCCDWLSNLMDAGLITPGKIDNRDIRDVHPNDLSGFDRCHFFAGIGVWDYALTLAGWGARPVWTGSCPCQPFSAAGGRAGFDDERHLWPAFHWLISQRRPEVVFGEQVASKDGLAWLDLVSADMQGSGYTFGAVDLCGAGFGAPHIRQRLWFVGALGGAEGDPRHEARLRLPGAGRDISGVAERPGERRLGRRAGEAGDEPRALERPERFRDAGGLEHFEGDRWLERRPQSGGRRAPGGCVTSGLADGDGGNARAEGLQRGGEYRQQPQDRGSGVDGPARPTDGFWRAADWLFCRDGKWRPVEPSTFPLAHGAPARVGRLRAYGNAIIAPVAAEFIEAVRAAL